MKYSSFTRKLQSVITVIAGLNFGIISEFLCAAVGILDTLHETRVLSVMKNAAPIITQCKAFLLNNLSLLQKGKPGDCGSNMLETEKKVRPHYTNKHVFIQSVFMYLDSFY